MDSHVFKKALELVEENIRIVANNGGVLDLAKAEHLTKLVCLYDKLDDILHGGDDENLSTDRFYGGGHMSRHYSGHSRADKIIYHIEELMEVAPSDRERRMLGEWLRLAQRR